jgi:probable phosphomutase (TIGR03848 family)
MTTLVLVRHAQTDAAGKRLTGQAPGVHLNEHGRTQAEHLAERLEGLPIRAIYSSPLERSRETAAPLARIRGVPVRVRRGLTEVGYGEWTGRSISSLRRTRLWRQVMAAPSTVRFPGGESLLEVQGRAVSEVQAITKLHPRDLVVAISHADVIRLLVAHLTGLHADHLHRLVIDPASVTMIALGDGIPRLLRINDTGSLPGRRTRGAEVRG